MKISREDVLRVAELAYLDLSEGELEKYRAQIDEILEYIGKLNELDTSSVAPMAQVLSDDQTADATLREDLIVPCAVAEDVLKHAPDPEAPYFRVPKVIERWGRLATEAQRHRVRIGSKETKQENRQHGDELDD